MLISVKLTRMELLKIKKRIKIAEKGHKLLKDKRDNLMKNFLEIIKVNKAFREDVEKDFLEFYKEFGTVRCFTDDAYIPQIHTKEQIHITLSKKSILGVTIPSISSEISTPENYSYVFTPIDLDKIVDKFRVILMNLLQLAEIEKSIELLANEIASTRRRVNALEHILIPELNRTVKYIDMKLEELERCNFCNLMRIKDIIKG